MLKLVSLSIFVFFLMCFFKLRSHILSLLVALESMMLMVLCYLLQLENNIFLALLPFAAAEAAVGLSLLVAMIRLCGSSLVKNINWYA